MKIPIFKIVSTIKTYKRLNTFKLKYTLQKFKYNSKVKHMDSMCCYLCDSQSLIRSSSQKAINFAGQIYTFFRCKKCGSYSLFPKLDQDIIAKLYSSEYSDISCDLHEEDSINYLSKFSELRKFLLTDTKSNRTLYLDYGCGFNPVTLGIASSVGLDYKGVEFSQDVVEQGSLIFPGRVATVEDFNKTIEKYDYIFIGDVIEHLSAPIEILGMLSTRLSSHGVLIAQGPLQGAFTVTQLLVNIKSRLFSRGISYFPPYHVSLATRKGMRGVLEASSLELLQLKISEPHWPAPSFSSVLKRPSIRGIIILTSKMLDKAISKFLPNYGTYYFIVAQNCVE